MNSQNANLTSPSKQPRVWRVVCISAMSVLIVAALILVAVACSSIFASNRNYAAKGAQVFAVSDFGDYDDSSTRCRVEFTSADGNYTYFHTYTYEEWESISQMGHLTTVIGHIFETPDGTYAVFAPAHRSADSPLPTDIEIRSALRSARTLDVAPLLNAAMAVALAAIGFAIMAFAGHHFTTYEKCWFLSIMVLAAIFAVIFPEEDVNGVNGLIIMALYLADTLLNILCELLISKQSKWNFIVSLFVEITEIAICLVLAYRFATMISTLFFWIPIDIVSFINWNKHPDRRKDELTQVRRMPIWLSLLLFFAIVAVSQGIAFGTDAVLTTNTELFGGNRLAAKIVNHIDWFATFVAIANGVFIFFRFEEQWIAWILDAMAEAAMNIIAGQYVLLVLKAGYLTNSTYGYIKWRKYIKAHPELAQKRSFF